MATRKHNNRKRITRRHRVMNKVNKKTVGGCGCGGGIQKGGNSNTLGLPLENVIPLNETGGMPNPNNTSFPVQVGGKKRVRFSRKKH